MTTSLDNYNSEKINELYTLFNNEVLSMKTQYNIEYNSILQGIFRFLYSNSREKNLTNLLTFYQTVYSLIDELLNSQYLNNSSIKNFINFCISST